MVNTQLLACPAAPARRAFSILPNKVRVYESFFDLSFILKNEDNVFMEKWL